jgi:DNA-binding NarL/FixJ family response regulator
MIRVRVNAPSVAARKRIENLIRASPDFEIVKNSGDANGAGRKLREDDEPDAVVAEFESRLDESAADALDEATGGAAVILLVHTSAAEWMDTLRQGVRAVLPANVSAPQLAAAIEAAVAGLMVLHPCEAENVILPRPPGESREGPAEELTPREIEVLRWMAEGLGNKEIAAKLAISEHTAKFHVASILGKLGAATRTEAVTQGIRRGLVLI